MADSFVHIGMGNVVHRERVIAIIQPGTATFRRYKEKAKDEGKFISAELGREIKAVLILDDGTVITSAIKPRTLAGRFNGDTLTSGEDEADDEDC